MSYDISAWSRYAETIIDVSQPTGLVWSSAMQVLKHAADDAVYYVKGFHAGVLYDLCCTQHGRLYCYGSVHYCGNLRDLCDALAIVLPHIMDADDVDDIDKATLQRLSDLAHTAYTADGTLVVSEQTMQRSYAGKRVMTVQEILDFFRSSGKQ